MNELQQVLVVFAILVILGLYIIQKRKSSKEDSEPSATTSLNTARKQADQALNDLGEPHIPVSAKTEERLNIEDEVPENQTKLPFDDIEPVEPQISEDSRQPKHVVIEAEDLKSIDDFDLKMVPKVDHTPNFGRPDSVEETVDTAKASETQDPQMFAIIVMGTEATYSLAQIKQAMLGVGLVASESGIFVKKDTMGNDIIKVANIMEPGIFPAEEDPDFATQGVVMILELPTTVKAPAVMHDLIMMARKMSQRLKGRMYNIERHLMKESDLQAMRDAAVAYESEAL